MFVCVYREIERVTLGKKMEREKAEVRPLAEMSTRWWAVRRRWRRTVAELDKGVKRIGKERGWGDTEREREGDER